MKLPYPQSREVEADLIASVKAFPRYGILKDGVIKQAMGLEPLAAPPVKNLVCAHILPSGDGLAYTKDRTVYRITDGDITRLRRFNTLEASSPFFVEMQAGARTDLLLAGDKTSVLLRNSTCGFASGFPPSACAAVRCGRVFAADSETGFILRWSGMDDILNWQKGIAGSGYYYADPAGGKITRLFDFGGEIVALRERGITCFSVGGTPESFRVSRELVMTGKILPATAAVAGGGLYFCCGNDVLRFSNGKAEKLDCGLFGDASNFSFGSAAYGRYYLLKALSKKLGYNVVYVYDVLLQTGYVLETDALCMYENGDDFIIDAYLQAYRFAKHDGYEVEFGEFDFGVRKRKLLTELIIDCDGETSVTVSGGSGTCKFKTEGSKKLGIRGGKFSLSVSGTGDIRALKLKAEVRK